MIDPVGVLIGAVFALFGIAIGYTGYTRLSQLRRVNSMSARDPGEVTPGETAKVTGTVQPAGQTHTGPVDGDAAVVTEYVIESKGADGTRVDDGSGSGRRPREGGGTLWDTRLAEHTVESFHLVGQNGDRLLVAEDTDPQTVLSLDAEVMAEMTERDLREQGNVLALLDRTAESLQPFDFQNEWRHRQASIRPGETAIVFGTVTEGSSTGPSPPAVEPADGDLIVLDQEGAFGSPWRFWLVTGIGAAMLLAGIGFLAQQLPV